MMSPIQIGFTSFPIFLSIVTYVIRDWIHGSSTIGWLTLTLNTPGEHEQQFWRCFCGYVKYWSTPILIVYSSVRYSLRRHTLPVIKVRFYLKHDSS